MDYQTAYNNLIDRYEAQRKEIEKLDKLVVKMRRIIGESGKRIADLEDPWTYIKHDPDGRPVAETLPEAGKHYEVSGLLQETDRTLKVWRIAQYRGGGEWHDVWTDGRLKYEVYAYQSLPDPAPLPEDRG